jgi:hypothetical protein
MSHSYSDTAVRACSPEFKSPDVDLVVGILKIIGPNLVEERVADLAVEVFFASRSSSGHFDV